MNSHSLVECRCYQCNTTFILTTNDEYYRYAFCYKCLNQKVSDLYNDVEMLKLNLKEIHEFFGVVKDLNIK